MCDLKEAWDYVIHLWHMIERYWKLKRRLHGLTYHQKLHLCVRKRILALKNSSDARFFSDEAEEYNVSAIK